jgi:hemoglobin/transferrin/lactoferrin receptor protein
MHKNMGNGVSIYSKQTESVRPGLQGLVIVSALLGSAALSDAAAQQAPVTLDPVTITATKTEHSVDEVPANVTVIDSEQIDSRSPSKIDDLLRDLPGVDMAGGPRRVGQDVNIRGFGGQRVVTTLDGARQNFNAGHKGRFFLDPDLLKRVEVVRGSNSALHGSGAIGGVISMETKDASDFLDSGETVGFRTKYGHSSVARENYYSAGAFGRIQDKVDLLANYSYRDSGTLKQGDDRELTYSAEDLRDVLLKATVKPAEGHKLSFSVVRFKEDGNTLSNPDAQQSATEAYPVYRYTDQRTYSTAYSFSNPDLPLINPTVKLYRNELTTAENRLPPATTRYDKTRLTTDGFDVYNTARFDTGGFRHTVTAGMEYYQDNQQAYRNNAARPGYPRAFGEVTGYYVQDEIELFKGFTLTPSGRYDQYELKANTARDVDEGKFSPKLAANWQALNWLTLYSSYGYGFRAPSLLEMYVAGPHTGPGNQFIPNPNLKPETTETAEGGLRFKFDNVATDKDSLRLNATYFHTRAEDFIETIVTGTAGAGSTTNQNIPKAVIHGAELSAAYDTTFAFSSMGYSRIRGENDNTGRPLDSIPADKFVAVLGGKLPEYGVKFGWRGEFVAEQDQTSGVPFITGAAPTPTTSGYAVHSLFVSWLPLPEYLQGFRVDAGIENLFDNTYRRHLASLYEEGRDYRVSVSYTKGF